MRAAEFELIRRLDDGTPNQTVWLARRACDGQELVACAGPDPDYHPNARPSAADQNPAPAPLGNLLGACGGRMMRALLALLNHPNLVSLAGSMRLRDPFANDDPGSVLFVWDYPNAGRDVGCQYGTTPAAAA